MRRLVLPILIALLACGPTERFEPAEGQILLFVDTDAPVASAANVRARADEPVPLFDRLRIEVFAPGATTPCDGCTNEFAIDADRLSALGVSIGIAPPPGVSGFRARARLFLTKFTKEGEPDPDNTIDVIVALPAIEATGKASVTVQMNTDDVGKQTGTLDAPIDALLGEPAESRVGTWPSAERKPCSHAPRDGEVCIPGGAYWMGGKRGPWSFIPGHDTLSPRLVVLAPFYIGAHEVTVREFRTWYVDGAAHPWSGAESGAAIEDFCTFTIAPDAREDFPVNCLPWGSAHEYCNAHGGELPSEAQWEYVASALVGSTYVWGEDPPSCADAIFSRLGYGVFASSVTYCKPPAPPGGATPIGSGQRDRLEMPTGTVIDLMGNVTEWLIDRWSRSSEPCWSRPGVYVDPVCNTDSKFASETEFRSARGGDWLVPGGQLAHTVRVGAPAARAFYSPEAGFRCMRPEPGK
jgi:formylglycine-generating enzyme required for sulfatase activity